MGEKEKVGGYIRCMVVKESTKEYMHVYYKYIQYKCLPSIWKYDNTYKFRDDLTV